MNIQQASNKGGGKGNSGPNFPSRTGKSVGRRTRQQPAQEVASARPPTIAETDTAPR